jgi:shikimate dehydrogenase
MDRYAVMGNPIGHSKSPMIHGLFAQQTGQDLKYEALLVPVDGFAAAVRNFQHQGGKGLNITVPFKQEAWQLVSQRSEQAERAGAVNTLSFKEQNVIIGDNTDGTGLVRDICSNHKFTLQEKNILVLGAGGAVRGVLEPLLSEQPQRVVIANRTLARAEQLVQIFSPMGTVNACGFEDIPDQAFDLIINGTAASLQGEMPPLPPQIAQQAFCYDMMYGKEPTIFMQWAQQHGANDISDGLGMLVEQAAESFFIWRGVRPNTDPVIKAVRRSI